MKTLLDLFFTFFKTGLFTFGGGYAMLPMLQREIVDRKKYATNEEVMEYYAIGQCTPGLIAVNTSTFIGYKQKGVIGGIVATLGFICPSVIIICLLAGIIDIYADFEVVKNAFAGIRACVCVLIINAVIRLWKTSIDGMFTFAVFALVLIAAVAFDINPVVLVIASGITGVVYGAFLSRRTASADMPADAPDSSETVYNSDSSGIQSAGEGKEELK